MRTHAENLRVAASFAAEFQRSAEAELDGRPPIRRQSAMRQLRAALHDIDCGDADLLCECKHPHFDHSGMTGGMCLKPGCKCAMFQKGED